MNDKELRVVKQHASDLPDKLFDILLERLEKALADRPFWLKLYHFITGNAKWIEKTVSELVDRIHDEFGEQ